MNEPPDMDSLNATPGRQWSAVDIFRIKQWWFARPQMRRVIFYAAHYLGREASRQDIEDAVADFFWLIDPAVRSYQPGGLPFCSYLLRVCFWRHCLQAGEAIRLHHAHNTTWDSSDLVMEFADTRREANPYFQAEYGAILTELTRVLNTATLPEPHKHAFLLRYLEGYSYQEIAVELDAPINSVKSWVHRTTVKLRKHFRKRRWTNEPP